MCLLFINNRSKRSSSSSRSNFPGPFRRFKVSGSMFKVPSLQQVRMGPGQEVASVSAIVLETDVSSCNHAVESAPQPALEKSSGVRNQQYQGKKIGEHSGYDQ